MNVMRLQPLSALAGPGRDAGHCSACGNRIAACDSIVLMYGERFHRDCAFYRRSGDRVRPRA